MTMERWADWRELSEKMTEIADREKLPATADWKALEARATKELEAEGHDATRQVRSVESGIEEAEDRVTELSEQHEALQAQYDETQEMPDLSVDLAR